MDKVNEALGLLVDMVRSTKDFVGDQSPLVAKEIVSYQFTTSIFWAVVFSIFFIYLASYWNRAKKYQKNHPGDFPSAFFLGGALFGMVFLIGMFTQEAIKAKIAPRLCVLDYVKKNVGHE